MLEHKIRQSEGIIKFEDFVVKNLMKIKQLEAEHLTLAAFIFGILIIPSLYFQFTIVALIFLVVSGILDIFDGSLARAKNKQSDLGCAYDLLSDRAVESCIIIGLFAYDPEERGIFCLMMLASILLCVTTFLTVGLFDKKNSKTKKSFNYSHGLIERAEAFIFFAVLILFPDSFHFVAIIFSLLTGYTALMRLLEFKKSQIIN